MASSSTSAAAASTSVLKSRPIVAATPARSRGRPAELIEPSLDHRLHAWAQRATVRPTRAQRLDDEQRVALGLTVEPLRVLTAECGAGQHLSELGRLGSARTAPVRAR